MRNNILALIFMLSPIFAHGDVPRQVWEDLSQTYAVYVGDTSGSTNVYSAGRERGRESFDFRYGRRPSIFGSLVSKPLTESFVLSHPQKTDYVFVYFHGIHDSPFLGKDIVRALHSHGHNVMAVRLTGHGVQSPRGGEASLADWRRDVSDAVEQAKALGRKIVLIGHSTGAALAIDRVLRNPEDIAGLVPIAPAVGMNLAAARIAGRLGLIRPLSRLIPEVGNVERRQVEVRQLLIASGALASLYELGDYIQKKLAALKKSAHRSSLPALFITSENDEAIQAAQVPRAVEHFASAQWMKFEQAPSATRPSLSIDGNILHVSMKQAPSHVSMQYDPAYTVHPFDTKQILDFHTEEDTNPAFEIMMNAILEAFPTCADYLSSSS